MKKREIRRFIKRCNNGVKEAKKATMELNSEQVIEIRANIKGRYVKFDRWGSFLSFVALAIAAEKQIELYEAELNKDCK